MVDIHALNLRPNESLVFDGSAETNGSFRILSGAGDGLADLVILATATEPIAGGDFVP